MNGSPSVKVALFIRNGGSESCRTVIFIIANEAAEENRKKKRDTPYAQIIDSILIYGNFSSGLLDKSFL